MSIGENIKELRKKKNLTQKEFASKVGISRSYLGDLENNRKSPSADTINKLSKILGVSEAYLFTGKDEEQTASNDRQSIEAELSSILESDKEHVINKQAFDNTVDTFEDSKLPLEDMDLIEVYMENIRYYEGDGTLINSKESYIQLLEQRIKVLEYNLDEQILDSQAEKELKDREEQFKNIPGPTKEQLKEMYRTTYSRMVSRDKWLIEQLSN